jgi:hypothetical protein
MITVPKIVDKTVSEAAKMPVFAAGFLRLAVMPPSAPPTSKIKMQDPSPGTMLDAGGTVTAIIDSQTTRGR